MKQINQFEEFKNVKDYYYIDREGNVYGLGGNILAHKRGGRNGDYNVVGLMLNDGRRRNIRVHRLVAAGFLPNPDGKPQVNHKDKNPRNNRWDNLEWVTQQENIDHSQSYAIIGECIKTGETIRFKSAQEAARNGFHQSAISLCLNGQRKTHLGYKWTREEDNREETKNV